MNFISFLLSIVFIIYLFDRLNKGPFVTQNRMRKRVFIKNHLFDKESINVKKGDIIQFINKDQIRHTIKTNNIKIQNSPILFQDDIWEYSCNIDDNNIIFESSLYTNMNKIMIIVDGNENGKSSRIELQSNISEISNVISRKINGIKKSLMEKIRNIFK